MTGPAFTSLLLCLSDKSQTFYKHERENMKTQYSPNSCMLSYLQHMNNGHFYQCQETTRVSQLKISDRKAEVHIHTLPPRRYSINAVGFPTNLHPSCRSITPVISMEVVIINWRLKVYQPSNQRNDCL